MTKKTIAIVDPYSSGSLLAKEFQFNDYECIAIHSQKNIPDCYVDSFKEHDFKEILYFKDDDLFFKSLLDHNLHAIIAGTESGVSVADKLSFKLNLMHNKYEFITARRDKFEMQETIKSQYLASIKQIKSSNLQEIHLWLKKENIPICIIKPLSSAGSDKVFKCNSKEEVEFAFHQIINKLNALNQINLFVLVQEFLHGIEYVVDTVSLNGFHFETNLCVYKKCSANGSDVVYREMTFLHPADKEFQLIIEYNRKVLDALGIVIGPSHSEIMLTDRGPILIEVGSRIHGGMTPRTVQNFSSVSQLDLTVDAYTNTELFMKKTANPPIFNKYALVHFFINSDEGIVDSIISENILKNLNSFFDVIWHIECGQKVHKTIDLFTATGWVVLMNQSLQQLNYDKQIVIELENENKVFSLK